MSVMMPQGQVGPSLPGADAPPRSGEKRWRDRAAAVLHAAAPLMRVLWIACTLFSVYVFFATNPSRARQIQDVFSLNNVAFSSFGFDRDMLSAYIIALDTLAFLSYALVGVLIFWRKPSERVALSAHCRWLPPGSPSPAQWTRSFSWTQRSASRFSFSFCSAPEPSSFFCTCFQMAISPRVGLCGPRLSSPVIPSCSARSK